MTTINQQGEGHVGLVKPHPRGSTPTLDIVVIGETHAMSLLDIYTGGHNEYRILALLIKT